MKDLNISCDTIQVLEEKLGSKISHVPHSNVVADISLTAREIKEKWTKWDYIKLKSLYTKTVWENIFTNDTSDKGLISKIYKEFIWFNTRNKKNPIKKWAKDMNRHFSKEDKQRAHKHMKQCSTLIAIRETEMGKRQWGISSHLPKWPSSTNQQTTSAGEDVEKRVP